MEVKFSNTIIPLKLTVRLEYHRLGFGGNALDYYGWKIFLYPDLNRLIHINYRGFSRNLPGGGCFIFTSVKPTKLNEEKAQP